MQDSRILQDVTERLERLSIYDLRQVARAVGVKRPADGKKSRVTEAILSIAQGLTAPEPPTLRGAPPKSQAYDEQLVADIKACREYYLALKGGFEAEEPKSVLSVADSGAALEEKEVSGILDKSEKYCFLRVHGASVSDDDVFVHDSFLQRFSLREGDFVSGVAKRRNKDEAFGLVTVLKVNGKDVEEAANRPCFSKLTPIYPETNVKTAHGNDSIACRIIDMFAPLGLGQRAVISAPLKSEKSQLLKELAVGISQNCPQIKLIVTLIDERPEEITDFKRVLGNAELFYTTFDMPAERHVQTAHLAIEYAKRRVEYGEDVIVLFDGLTRLIHAYTGGNAIKEIKKLLYCACNTLEGGTLTLISTISNDVKDEAYHEFLSTANMAITLSRSLAQSRVFPAINIKATGADREEILLSEDELKAANYLCARFSSEEIIDLFKQTSDNGEIVSRFKN